MTPSEKLAKLVGEMPHNHHVTKAGHIIATAATDPLCDRCQLESALADASRTRERELLEARLEEARWWKFERPEKCYICCDCEASVCLHPHALCGACLRIDELDAQIAALAAKDEGSAT